MGEAEMGAGPFHRQRGNLNMTGGAVSIRVRPIHGTPLKATSVEMAKGLATEMLDDAQSDTKMVSALRRPAEGDAANEDLRLALQRCAAGDREGLRIVFESEGGRLVAMATRILKRRDLAEEVVQEAFLRIFEKAHQYDPSRGSARGWIYAIVRSRSLNALRDARFEEPSDTSALEALGDARAVDEALGALARLDATSRLRECLSALDEPKRRSVLMAYVSGYTHGEIAGRLAVPLGTAKAWVRRGLASLRDCMA